jgi:glutathione peroxidase
MEASQMSVNLRRATACLLTAVALIAYPLHAHQALAGDCPAILKHSFNSLQTGQPQDLCQYQGKVVLVVNTASYCGYTDQYGGLEELYRRYRDQGLVVLGFPANDFGNQEPESNAKIAKFCRLTYGVEFPMFEKSRVVGAQRNPLYTELHKRTGAAPRWNFHKYLIDPNGERVLSFESAVPPDDKRLLDELRKMLDARKKRVRRT